VTLKGALESVANNPRASGENQTDDGKQEYRSKWATSSTPAPAAARAVPSVALMAGERHISSCSAT